MTTPVLKVGCNAYLDSLIGLVPCKVEKIWQGEFLVKVELRVTDSRGGYKKGELLETISRCAIPITAVYLRDYQYWIKPYTVELPHTIT